MINAITKSAAQIELICESQHVSPYVGNNAAGKRQPVVKVPGGCRWH